MLHVVAWADGLKCGSPLEKLLLLKFADGCNMDSIVGAHFDELADYCSTIETEIVAAIRRLEARGAITARDWIPNYCTVMLPWDLFKQFHEVAPRRQLTRHLRSELVKAFGGVCQYCQGHGGKDLGPDGHIWNIEHIVPRSKGGSDEDDNLTLACKTCNQSKRSKPAPAGTPSLASMKVTT